MSEYEYRNGRWFKKKKASFLEEALTPEHLKKFRTGMPIVHVQIPFGITGDMMKQILRDAEAYDYILMHDTTSGIIFKNRVLVFKKL